MLLDTSRRYLATVAPVLCQGINNERLSKVEALALMSEETYVLRSERDHDDVLTGTFVLEVCLQDSATNYCISV